MEFSSFFVKTDFNHVFQHTTTLVLEDNFL